MYLRDVSLKEAFGEVLRVTVEGGADLVVCGRSPEEIQLGERLARKAPCSVLSVPADASPGFGRILAPVDYSAFSRQALDVALAFAQAGGVKLTAMHAFEVHWGHGRSALSREEFVADLREFHERRLREFVDETGRRGVEVEYLVRESALPGAAIADEVARGGHDLVVVGCRGHDAIYATLLGSTGELAITGEPGAWTIQVPDSPLNPIAAVVSLEFKAQPTVEMPVITPDANGRMELPALDATLHGDGLKIETQAKQPHVGFWVQPTDFLSWKARIPAGTYQITVRGACETKGSEMKIRIGSTEQPFKFPTTGSWKDFKQVMVGKITVPETTGELSLHAISGTGHGFLNLRSITLAKQP